LAIVVDQKLELQQVIDGMIANRPSIVKDISLFDVYTGKGIAAGEKSLAFRIVMQDTQRTLQEAEVDNAVQELIEYLQKTFAAQLRV
jgi:phenylalanyl-tRNA synthetase beta chain